MDLMLTKNGDLFLEERNKPSHEIGFLFFIKPSSSAIALLFDFDKSIYTPHTEGVLLTFDFNKKQAVYAAQLVTDEQMVRQMCYNAIRTQKNSLSHALTYGSNLYLETNKKITDARLESLGALAKEAIKDFLPDAQVTCQMHDTTNGRGALSFQIFAYTHTLTLDYNL